MAAVQIKNVFPCATAPFGEKGASRLFTEENISALFSFIFDIDKDYCIVSPNKKYMVFNGYMFIAPDGQQFTVTDETTYYIVLTVNNELWYDENNSTALFDSSPVTGLENPTIVSATPQMIKFVQTSIDDIKLRHN